MSAYTELAARLRKIVSVMNTADIDGLEEQTDFIESIKSFLKKHDSRSLQTLSQRLQEYSIIDLTELDGVTLSECADSQITNEQWASLVAPQRDIPSNEAICGNSSTSMQAAFTMPIDIENEKWNFFNMQSMPNDTNSSSIDNNSILPQSLCSSRSDFDAQSLCLFPSTHHLDLPHNLEGTGQSETRSAPAIPAIPVQELLGDFSGMGQAGLSQMKAEEVVHAAKSLIREDLHEFLNTFLSMWQNQGLWRNTNVELIVDSGTSHERLESAYRCLTRLGLCMADDPVRSRMASIVLHREFHAACLMLKEKLPSEKSTGKYSQRGQGLATSVIDYTLRRIYNDFDRLTSTRQKELRAEFHDNKRFGKRWERLASSIGYGILIVCSKSVNAVIKKTTFTDSMLHGLAFTVRKHMPDCTNLITELDELAISLLDSKPMTTTLNQLILEEKMSQYFNGICREDLHAGVIGKV